MIDGIGVLALAWRDQTEQYIDFLSRLISP